MSLETIKEVWDTSTKNLWNTIDQIQIESRFKYQMNMNNMIE